MPKVIGLTGGIATGKSTVSEVWREAGFPVIDADKVAREVVEPGRPALRLIRWSFGAGVLKPDGSLDRPALGRIIFADPAKRQRLNLIMHPFIISSMVRQLLFSLLVRFEPVVILDTPLLFESGTLLPICGATVVVACNDEQQVERLVERSAASDDRNAILTEEEAKNRIAAQMPLSMKVERADHVLDNSGSVESLTRQSKELVEQLRPSPAGEVAFRMVVIGVVSKFSFNVGKRVLTMVLHRS